GPFTWTFQPTTQSFTGNFAGTPWCGARTGQVLPANCGFSGNWNIRLLGGNHTMSLTQTGSSVAGSYNNGIATGTVSCAVSFASGFMVLTGNYNVSCGTGSLKFFVPSNYASDRFQGNWNTSNEWCGFRGGAPVPSPCLK